MIRKVKIAVLIAIGAARLLWAADSSPLANQYTGDTPGKIRIMVRMKGVAFSLDNTLWDLTGGGGLMPNATPISPRYTLQNDGGVNIDLSFRVGDSTAVAPWTFKPTVSFAVDSTYPATDRYFLEPYITDPGGATPTIASFSGIGVTDTYTEADSTRWAHNSSARASGVNLPAYVPGRPSGDQVNLFLLFVAPASSSSDVDHTIILEIQAKLAD